jgi:SAM-dependent methyltransferase
MFSSRFDAWGIDTSPQAIEFCRQRGLSKLHCGTLEEFTAPAPFDLVTMLDVVEHVEDDMGLLRAALPLLGPRGRLLIAVPAFPSLWSAHDEMLHHKRRYTRTLLRRVVTEAGFVIDHISFFNTFLFPAALVRRTVSRLAGQRQTNDLEIPPEAVNAFLRGLFSAEGTVLRRGSFPFGLSLLCLATKAPR